MIALLIFIFVLSVLIVFHEFGHFIAAKRVGVRVEQFSMGFGPKLIKKKKGDTVYSVAAIPLGGFVKLAGDNLEEYKGRSDEYFSKNRFQRFQIIFAGPFLNYILGILCFWFIFFAGYPALTTKVGALKDGFGAKQAGLLVEDKITAIDGKAVVLWEDLQKRIQGKSTAGNVTLKVLRRNIEFEVKVPLRSEELTDIFGQKHSLVLIGIAPDFTDTLKMRHGFFTSLRLGFNKAFDLTAMTYKALWFMVSGKLSMRESVAGPLGIFDITSKAAKLGMVAVLNLMGMLSISLAIFNLLPFPVLDGGHIFFLLLEKIRGKPLSIKVERIVTQTGLSLIIILAVFVTYNDIVRMFGDKIHKFFIR